MQSKLNEDVKELETKYKDLIADIKIEKGYQKIPVFDKTAQSEYVAERTNELETAKRESISRTRTQSENRKIYLNGFFKFFKIGYGYYYPALSFETDSSDNSYCIFLGFDINEKRNNPYAPSAVKLRFAIADSRKYIVLAASGDTAKEIERIQARSFQLSTSQKETLIDKWDEAIKAFTQDRQNRYIVTGNILQGAADFSGKLVSFTTKGKGIKKGILMSEAWSPDNTDNNANSYVVAPIAKLQKHIMSLRSGASIITENKISIIRHYDDTFKIIMPKTKTHIPIFTDREVIKLLVNNRDGFEMVSGNMKATVIENKMPKLIKLLGERFSLSVKIPRNYFNEFLEKGSKRSDSTDSLTQEAMKMFENDKKVFQQKLAKQKQTTKKGKTIRIDKSKSLKLVKLRAKAILIKQKQMRNVAGLGRHPKVRTIL